MDLTKYFGEEGIVVDRNYVFKEGKDVYELQAEMRSHGLLVEHLDLSGKLVRVQVSEGAGCKADKHGQRSGWYTINQLGNNYFAVYGNWKTGFENKWSSVNANTLTPQENLELKKQMLEAHKRRNKAEKDRHEEVAKEIKLLFGSFKNITEHEYLTSKKVKNYGLKVDQQGNLVVGVYDTTGNIRSLQYIDKKGGKRFAGGGEIKGNIFLVGADYKDLPNLQTLVIAEGYSTSATIYEATNLPVACVFSANFCMDAVNNLRKITRSKILIALDRDENGVGQRKAEEVCQGTDNCFMRIPSITGDYNDMYLEHGLARVEKEISDQGLGITRYAIRNLVNDPPPRVWLVDSFLEQSKPSILASIGGVGKSMLALDLSLKIAKGQGDWFGHPVSRQGNAVVLSAEDDQAEIHRRVKALDPNDERYDTKYDVFAFTVPDTTKPLILLRDDATGLNITEQANELIAELEQIPDLELVVIDPIQAMSSAPLSSSNEAAQLYCQLCASISSQMQCSVLSIHHMSKTALSHADDPMSARASIRGASSLVDGHRLAIGLWLGNEEESERICVDNGVEHDPLRVVRGGVVKSNSSEIDTSVKTMFRRDAVLEPYVESKFNIKGF